MNKCRRDLAVVLITFEVMYILQQFKGIVFGLQELDLAEMRCIGWIMRWKLVSDSLLKKFGKARDGPSMLKLDVKDSCSNFFVWSMNKNCIGILDVWMNSWLSGFIEVLINKDFKSQSRRNRNCSTMYNFLGITQLR